MQFLSSLFPVRRRYPRPSMDMHLIGDKVLLRLPEAADWRPWRAMRELSRDFLTPWEPTWPANATQYSFYCGQLRRFWREWRQGEGYNFSIFLRSEDGEGEGALIGGLALNDIQRGISQKGTLGYWIGEPYAGHGYMTEAVTLVCDFAFEILKLHRIEAACLPNNLPSKSLLRRMHFEQEGYAKAYLQINGQWEDHLLWGKTIST